jgi:hypothetical protein
MLLKYNIEIINTKKSQYTQFSCKNACERMFPIVSHVKNNIECVLTVSDNTPEDLSMGIEAFICTETFQEDRSLQRCMAQSSSGYFVWCPGV